MSNSVRRLRNAIKIGQTFSALDELLLNCEHPIRFSVQLFQEMIFHRGTIVLGIFTVCSIERVPLQLVC